ncbi:MAG: M48 family metalloprotease, partial [Pseudomonadota bacterium]
MQKGLGRCVGALAGLALAALPGMASALGLVRDAEIERTLARLTNPILHAASISPATVDIYIVNDRRLNAFVAGGRNIFLNTGLLMELETPEELAGVIAHETGHIAGGHLARRQLNARAAQGPALIGTLLGIAAAAAGGGAAGAAIIAGSQSAAIRSFLRYSRAEEASADQAAIGYLERARMSPEGLLKVIGRFRGQEVLSVGSLDPYTLTHPLSTDRMQLLERAAAQARGRSYPEDPEREYWHARMRAKLEGFLDNPERVLDRHADAEPTELVLYARAVALHRLPSPREAEAAMDQLLALRPNDAFYEELKGQILFESGNAAAALPHYRRAV